MSPIVKATVLSEHIKKMCYVIFEVIQLNDPSV